MNSSQRQKRRLRPRQILCGFVVLCLALSGISPACKFLSGEAFAMEICKPDGSLVIMVMNDDGSVSEKEKPSQAHAEIDCAFCFSAQNLQTLAAADLNTPEGLSGQTGLLNQSASIARQSAGHLYAPRGPPVLS